jgi:hypothetical protein
VAGEKRLRGSARPRRAAKTNEGVRAFGGRAFIAEALEARLLLASVTIITHGQSTDGVSPAWLSGMAGAIGVANGESSATSAWTRTTWYSMTIGNGPAVTSFSKVKGPDLAQSSTGEVIVTVDWSTLTSLFTPSSSAIASAILPELLSPATGLPRALAEVPVHLIGHSRGASVMSELARGLGENGIWVDQLTTLDSYPSALAGDAAVAIRANTIFADNYYETTSFLVHGAPVTGASNFGPLALPGGNPGSSGDHSDVHSWYHGTIDTSPAANDGVISIPPDWYATDNGYPRNATGFYYTLTGGGTRPADGLSPDFGGTAVRASIAQNSNAQWPNVGDLRIHGGGSSFVAGQPLSVDLKYQDRDSTSSISFYLDGDKNPYDAGSLSIPIGQINGAVAGNAAVAVTSPLSTSSVPAGQYYLFAKITDAAGADPGRTRYAYIASPLTFTAATQIILPPGGTHAVYAKRDADGLHADFWIDAVSPGQGTPDRQFLLPDPSPISVLGGTGDDVLTADFSNGDPFPASGGSFAGGGGANALKVIGTTGNDVLTLLDGSATFTGGTSGNAPISLSAVPAVQFDAGGGGNDTFTVSGGDYTIDAIPSAPSPIALSLNATGTARIQKDQHFGALTITGTARLVLVGTPKLFLDNSSTPEATVRQYLKNGYNADATGVGNWNGVGGIVGTDAAADFHKSIGYLNGAYASDPLIGGTIPGQPALPAVQLVIRPALYGDLNLDGIVDDTDLQMFSGLGQYNQPNPRFGWLGGDLNYDGSVNDVDLQIFSGAGNYHGPAYASAASGPIATAPAPRVTKALAPAAEAAASLSARQPTRPQAAPGGRAGATFSVRPIRWEDGTRPRHHLLHSAF